MVSDLTDDIVGKSTEIMADLSGCCTFLQNFKKRLTFPDFGVY